MEQRLARENRGDRWRCIHFTLKGGTRAQAKDTNRSPVRQVIFQYRLSREDRGRIVKPFGVVVNCARDAHTPPSKANFTWESGSWGRLFEEDRACYCAVFFVYLCLLPKLLPNRG